jgi:hypothetical protein
VWNLNACLMSLITCAGEFNHDVWVSLITCLGEFNHVLGEFNHV